MVKLQFLENFDSEQLPFEQQKSEEDLPGYDIGYEAGVRAADLRQSQLAQTVVDRIVELQFSQAEAQKDALTSLRPLLNAVCNSILPELVDDIMRIHILDTLMQAADHDLSTGVVLSVNPSQIEALQAILTGVPDLKAQVRPDHSLGELDVLIGTNTLETQLDVQSLINSIKSAFNTIIDIEEGSQQHG